MRLISATITIDVPRERVFGLICDLSVRPAFTDHMFEELRLERVDPIGVGAGARFRIGDDGAWLNTVIDEVEPPHTVREHGHGGRVNRLPVFTVWELAEGPGPDGCELRLTFWSEPEQIFDRLRNPLGRNARLKRGWERALRRLKELAESGQPPPRVEVAGGDRLPAFVR